MEIVYLFLAIALILVSQALPFWHFSRMDKKVKDRAEDRCYTEFLMMISDPDQNQ